MKKSIPAFLIIALIGTLPMDVFASRLTFTETFTIANTSAWVAPVDVTKVKVELWGGGGGGGGSNANPGAGSGGAGGQYARDEEVNVTPGTSYNVVVAATAAGGDGASGTVGNDSTFDSTTVVAKGGAQGLVDSTAAVNGNTTGCVGDVCFAGGNGAGGVLAGASGGGGEGARTTGTGGSASGATAGTGGDGGDGGAGQTTSANGGAGSQTGGGGGGGKSTNNTNRIGGAGGAGQARLTYTIEDGGPVFVGVGAQSDGVASTLSPALPSGVVQNDLLVAIIAGRPGGSAGTNDAITPPSGRGWTQRGSRVRFEVGVNDLFVDVWYKFATSTSEETPTFTADSNIATAGGGWSAQIVAYRYVDQNNPWALSSPTTGTNAAVINLTPSSVSITSPGVKLFNVVASADDNNLDIISTSTQAFTARMSGTSYDATTGGNHAIALADRPVNTLNASVRSVSWVQQANGSDGWVFFEDALQTAKSVIKYTSTSGKIIKFSGGRILFR
jgi:hypothetical protein